MSGRSLSNRYKPYFVKNERSSLDSEIKTSRKQGQEGGARKYRVTKRALLATESSVETKKKSHHSKGASLDLDKETNYQQIVEKVAVKRVYVKINDRSSEPRRNFKKKLNIVKREELRAPPDIEPIRENEFMRNIHPMEALLVGFYDRSFNR